MPSRPAVEPSADSLEAQVTEIVSSWSQRRQFELQSDLWSDCRIEGDDVDELFGELLKQFGPLPTDTIQWDRHFEMNEPPFFFDLFGRRRKRFARDRVPLCVRDIVAWIKTKRWPIDYRTVANSSNAHAR